MFDYALCKEGWVQMIVSSALHALEDTHIHAKRSVARRLRLHDRTFDGHYAVWLVRRGRSRYAYMLCSLPALQG